MDNLLLRFNIYVVVIIVILKLICFDNKDMLRKCRERVICYIYIKFWFIDIENKGCMGYLDFDVRYIEIYNKINMI